MVGVSRKGLYCKPALILTFLLAFGANSAMINVGKFVRLSVEPGHMMTSVKYSRSIRQCAATCLSARCCPEQACCTAFCQSLTSSVCYLNMTSESLEQQLPDTSPGYKCFVREKPGCPCNLGYRLIRGQCAKLHQELKNQGEAQSRCEADGAHLYYFTNATTDELVISKLPGVAVVAGARYWVGARRETTSDYQWHDGRHLSDSDPVWRHGEPTRRGNEQCVDLFPYEMRLTDTACDSPFHFFCQIDV